MPFREKTVRIPVGEKKEKQVDIETLTKLLRDPVIVRVVTVLDIAHLSILELLESGLAKQDINHALTSGVIEIDKETMPKAITTPEAMLAAGDTYFQQFLSSKVRLTALGLFIADCIKGCQTEHEIVERARTMFESGTFVPPEHPRRPD